MNPAIAGPTTCESWRAVELRLTAERSRSRPTIEWMRVCCAGPPIAPARPWTRSIPKIHHTVTAPVRVAVATPKAAVMRRSCATIWTFRVSYRSASAPPYSENNVNGTQCANTIIPSQNGAAPIPTSCTTSRPRMTFSIPSPVDDTQLVIQYARNVGTCSAANRIGLTGAVASSTTGVAMRPSLSDPAVTLALADLVAHRIDLLRWTLLDADLRAVRVDRADALVELHLHRGPLHIPL